MRPIELLICDDHEIFRQGIHQVLGPEQSLRLVGEASNGQECLQQIQALEPDVILLDIRMPVMNGIDCLQQIREQKLPVRVIAMTQFDERRLIRQMLRLGVDGYVLKHTKHTELLKAIQQVVRGHAYYSAEVREKMHAAASPVRDPLFPELGEKEREVLWRICSEQPSKIIADAMQISVKTVENHRSALLRKTGASNLAGLVKWAVLNQYDLP